MDLTQPWILRSPRVIHRHRSLCQCIDWIIGFRHHGSFKRRIPFRQWRKTCAHAFTKMLRRLNLPKPFGGQAEFLQLFAVDLVHIRCRRVIKTHVNCEVLVLLIVRFVITYFFGKLMNPKPTILNVTIELIRMAIPATDGLTIWPPKTSQRTHTRFPLMVDDIVCVILIFGSTAIIDHARQSQPRP